MPTKTVDVRDAQKHLTEWLSLVKAGTEVILTDGNTPLARLVPVTKRTAGLHAGAIQASDDFDEPLPEEFWAGSG
jgi:antitoxin (DNA-binding transcriptional repressor) of toxin-antitoxin stability system